MLSVFSLFVNSIFFRVRSKCVLLHFLNLQNVSTYYCTYILQTYIIHTVEFLRVLRIRQFLDTHSEIRTTILYSDPLILRSTNVTESASGRQAPCAQYRLDSSKYLFDEAKLEMNKNVTANCTLFTKPVHSTSDRRQVHVTHTYCALIGTECYRTAHNQVYNEHFPQVKL